MTKNQAKPPKKNTQSHDLALNQKIDELTQDLQRLQAEFINYKRRAEEEKAQAINIGKQQSIIALLPVLDNIERALKHQPAELSDNSWVKGIASLASQLEGQLNAIGLKKIGQKDEVFDPNLHEAVSMDDKPGETEIILDVMQTGYMLGEIVIRPAMVVVTKK